jgi:hypothetical protein
MATKTKAETDGTTTEGVAPGDEATLPPPPVEEKPLTVPAGMPEQAVFMPMEVPPGTLCIKSTVYRTNNYYDANGVPIDTSEWQPGDPEPAFTERQDFYSGDLVYLPLWNPKTLEDALKTGEYARAEAQAEIKEKTAEFYQQTEATTGHPATYKKLMLKYRDELISRNLLIMPQTGLNVPKKEG